MVKVIGVAVSLVFSIGAQASEFNWGELKRERIELQLPR